MCIFRGNKKAAVKYVIDQCIHGYSWHLYQMAAQITVRACGLTQVTQPFFDIDSSVKIKIYFETRPVILAQGDMSYHLFIVPCAANLVIPCRAHRTKYSRQIKYDLKMGSRKQDPFCCCCCCFRYTFCTVDRNKEAARKLYILIVQAFNLGLTGSPVLMQDTEFDIRPDTGYLIWLSIRPIPDIWLNIRPTPDIWLNIRPIPDIMLNIRPIPDIWLNIRPIPDILPNTRSVPNIWLNIPIPDIWPNIPIPDIWPNIQPIPNIQPYMYIRTGRIYGPTLILIEVGTTCP